MVEDTITITVVGKEDVEWIRSKVQSGSFASEAEVVAQSIALSREEDAELDRWMREVVANRYDRHKAALEREEVLAAQDGILADPNSAVSIEQVRRDLHSDMQQRLKG